MLKYAELVIPIASVVIPAHNEYSVIGRCLGELLGQMQPGELEVVVACNGCTDETAEFVRTEFPQVKAVEIAESSKAKALNAGDSAVRAFPRIYLDADIVLSSAAARSLAAALGKGVRAGAPSPSIAVEDRGQLIRRFYRAWGKTPFMSDRVLGNGVYALSEEARHRFDTFPELLGDDLYVHSLFSFDERVTLEDQTFLLHPPRRVRDLVRVRTRVYRGNAQMTAFGVQRENTTGGSVAALVANCHSFNDYLDAVVYLGVNAVAKLRARTHVAKSSAWERDDSSR